MSLSVLIVDDSRVMRSFIRRVIIMTGLEVADWLEAADGWEALACLRENKIDIVFTDVNMPGMNGEELVRRMKQEALLPNILTIVVSTDATEEKIHRMIALGAHDYVAKPFSPEQLREKLQSVLPSMSVKT